MNITANSKFTDNVKTRKKSATIYVQESRKIIGGFIALEDVNRQWNNVFQC